MSIIDVSVHLPYNIRDLHCRYRNDYVLYTYLEHNNIIGTIKNDAVNKRQSVFVNSYKYTTVSPCNGRGLFLSKFFIC